MLIEHASTEDNSVRVDVDALTLAVVRHKLHAIAEEMVQIMTNTCFSPILNQNQDFSSVILDSDASTVAQAERVPIHMGAMSWAIKAMQQKHQGSLAPNDVLIANDPYSGGSHLPDVTIAQPIFGASGVFMWVALRAHQNDIGGISAGSYCASATEIWHEGLRIPPIKLVSAGTLHTDIIDLIALNSRNAFDLRGDVLAQLTAVNTGAERIQALAQRYGEQTLRSCTAAILDAAEFAMRQSLKRCRPGIFRSVSNLEGQDGTLIDVPVTVEISDGHAVIDLTGCPDQVPAYLNSPIANTRAAVNVAFLYLLDDELVLNDGSARAISIRTRKGSLVDPVEPAPVSSCTSLPASAIIEAILKAMSQAMPETAMAGFARRFRVVIAGKGRDGNNFIWHSFFNRGGAGANARFDGWPNLGGIHNPGSTPTPSIERTEATYPLVVHEYSLRAGSAGAGKHRGGLGGVLRVEYIGQGAATLNTSGDGVTVLPYGIAGGQPGLGHHHRLVTDGGVEKVIGPRVTGMTIWPRDTIVCMSAGGGGLGDPAERASTDIAADIRAGYS